MNFGEKFPYALLTFPKKLIAGLVPPTPSKNCPRWLPNTPTPSLKLSRLISLYTEACPNPTLSLQKHTSPHPAHPTHKLPHTNYTPPYTLLLRVDSDEMRQNRKVLALRCWNARKGPRMGPNVHEVDTARRTNKARACSMSVCCERGGANEGG